MIDDAADHPVEWPHNFHIGFELPSLDEVRALYEKMVAADVVMKTDVFKHERGSRFFCEVPGGVLVEINTRSDADETVSWHVRPVTRAGCTNTPTLPGIPIRFACLANFWAGNGLRLLNRSVMPEPRHSHRKKACDDDDFALSNGPAENDFNSHS